MTFINARRRLNIFFTTICNLFFSRFITRNNHEFHYKFFVQQAFRRRLQFCFRDCKSLHQNDVLCFYHEENHNCRISKNYIRSCDVAIRRFEKRCFEQRIRFYERILNKNLLSHEDKKTIKHRFSFANERTNRTLKSKFKTLFTSVLLRKTNKMSKLFIFD